MTGHGVWGNVHEAAEGLPGLDVLRLRCQAIAMLDAVVSAGSSHRYHKYRQDTGLASMDNGSGDYFTIAFTPAGALAYGFDHESDMSPWVQDDQSVWPGVLDAVPDAFAGQLAEPLLAGAGEFDPPLVTFCLWRLHTDDRWHAGQIDFPPLFGTRTDPDGAGLLQILGGGPDAYVGWAATYYSRPSIDPDAVAGVYAHEPLDQRTVTRLSPGRELDEVLADAEAIGFPLA